VWCSVCCSVFQCVTVCYRYTRIHKITDFHGRLQQVCICVCTLQYVAVHCSVLKSVAVCCRYTPIHEVTNCHGHLHQDCVCDCVLQCVAVTQKTQCYSLPQPSAAGLHLYLFDTPTLCSICTNSVRYTI